MLNPAVWLPVAAMNVVMVYPTMTKELDGISPEVYRGNEFGRPGRIVEKSGVFRALPS